MNYSEIYNYFAPVLFIAINYKAIIFCIDTVFAEWGKQEKRGLMAVYLLWDQINNLY